MKKLFRVIPPLSLSSEFQWLCIQCAAHAYQPYAHSPTVKTLFKAEVIWRNGPWRNAEAVEFATLAWVDWFNNRRLLEPIGDVPPIEFEQAYYRQREAHTAVA
jgi:transposase InsO family protein